MKKPRDLRKVLCNVCGSSYEVRYDVANDEYICKECLEEEEEAPERYDDLEETKEEQLIRRERGY